VIQIEAQSALVITNQVSGCEQCNGQGCGSSKVAQLFCSQPRQFLVANPIQAKVGDEVILAVAEASLLRSIGVIYLLPLILLIAGAGIFSYVDYWGERAVALGALAGLGLGFQAVKLFSSRLACQQQQTYIARLVVVK
jgi:sigma-E factor negative regulatory protein RseC